MNISSQLETIRDMLDRSDTARNHDWQIGDILIALSQITDLLDQTNKRIDQIDDWRERYVNHMDMRLNMR